MANSLSNLSLDLLAPASAEYLRTESAMLNKVYVETRQEKDLREGVKSVKMKLPGALLTPLDFSSTSKNDIAVPTVPLDFTFHKKIHFSMTELESRTTNGNFAQAFQDVLGGGLDGLAIAIDQSLSQLVKTLMVNAPVGTSGQAIADGDVRTALKQLEKRNVKSKNCYMVVSPENWWDGLLNEGRYVNVMNSGNSQPIQQGEIFGLYGMKSVSRSNNIDVVTGTPNHSENVIFDRYAFAIGFLEFEKAGAYGAPNVEEDILTDPDTGISLRLHRWYDPDTASWQARMDICWGVTVLDDKRAQRVLGA